MAYSGTISATRFNTRKVIDSAVRRTKVPAQKITSEHIDIANDQLFLLLSDLSNKGIQLWCIEQLLMPLYDGVVNVTLPVGTVDVLNSNLRTMTEVTGTNTDTSVRRTIAFDDETFVSTVGILWSGASAPLSFERSDDGVTWEVIQTEADPEAVAGERTWFDMDSNVAASYFRVRATTGTFDFSAIFTGNNPQAIPLSRLNRDQYTNLPNRTFQSNRPLQFWYNRVIPQPIMVMWPAPNAQAVTSLIEVWRQRHIMDVGTMTQEIEVPQRWYMAIVTMLAAAMAREIVEVDPKMIPQLDSDAAIALRSAQDEERDNSPIMIAPNISMYT